MRTNRVSLTLAVVVPMLSVAAACHRAMKAPPAIAAAPAPATVAATVPEPAAQSFRSPSGKTYTRTHVAPPDNDEPVTVPQLPPGVAPSTDTFQGVARRAAKLSIARGKPKLFSDLESVLGSLIPDAQMRALNISKAATSGRLPSEQAAVTVMAFLYASSQESDNDFHCIVGSTQSQPTVFTNMEVSGLPPTNAKSSATLQKVRNQFKAFFTTNGNNLPVQGYDQYGPPIPIKVTGSLFFDVDHIPPAVGPPGMKPQTAWELHPITDLQFEP